LPLQPAGAANQSLHLRSHRTHTPYAGAHEEPAREAHTEAVGHVHCHKPSPVSASVTGSSS
jgi:hypothetical protein